MEKIGVIYTTFLRNELAFKTIQSIQPCLSEEVILLIGDQNRIEQRININPNWHYTYYYDLPFDCGLSYSRNYLVQKAYQLGCKYVLITSDNIEFIGKYDFTPIIEFLNSDPKNGIVGFHLNHYVWEYNLSIENKRFVLSTPKNNITNFKGIEYKKYDLVKNFFLAKIGCVLKNRWDNRLKMTEHIDYFWRLKNYIFPYNVYYTNYIEAKRTNTREGQFKIYRGRHLTNEFRDIVKKKFGLKDWIIRKN